MTPPEKIDPGSIDFSQFHPMDHSPFTVRCRSFYPRGWRAGWYHIRMAWGYRDYPALRAATVCHVGLHRSRQWHSHKTTWKGCMDCAKPLGPKQPIDRITP